MATRADSPPAQTPREQEVAELRDAFRSVYRTVSRMRGRDTHLAGSDLSHAQFELLCELNDRGELSCGELAAAAHLAPATVTQMLEHLALSGHVERARSETDRRVVVSRLTPQARRTIQAKRRDWKSRWESTLQEFDASDVAAAARVLRRLDEMISSEPDPR